MGYVAQTVAYAVGKINGADGNQPLSTCLVLFGSSLCFSCLVRFPVPLFRSVHLFSGPSGFRFEASLHSAFGARAFACQTPGYKTIFLHHPAVAVYKWRVAIRLA